MEYIEPSIEHMKEFQANTLVRLLISFIPMADMLFKNGICPKLIASFGSGSCSHEVFLSDLYPGSVIDCFDSSKKYIPDYNRKKMVESGNINFTEINVETLDWKLYSNRYDLVYSIQTLEHIKEPETALSNFTSTVSRGGMIYIDTPFYSENGDLDDNDYLEKEKKRQWNKHFHYHLGFSPSGISERLKKLGFKTVDIGYSSYVNGDNKFLRFIRTDIFERQKADTSYVYGVAGVIHSLLTRNEKFCKDQFIAYEHTRHSERPALAIRVLAEKI